MLFNGGDAGEASDSAEDERHDDHVVGIAQDGDEVGYEVDRKG